jgi:uncharacterized membrane protein YhaH (DUF805 family)
MIGFGEAVQNGLDRSLSIQGRASRAEHWWWWLFVASLSALTGGSLLGTLILLALLVPSATVLIRRLHDTGRSGWSLLLLLIPFVGILLVLSFLVKPGDTASNGYGPPPAPVPPAERPVGPFSGWSRTWLRGGSPTRAGGWDDTPPPPTGAR